MAKYNRPLWVWLLILAFAGLVTFAAYSAFYHYEGDRYLLHTSLSERAIVVDRETYEEWCIPKYSWEDPPPCPITIEPPTVLGSLLGGALIGLLSLALAQLVVSKPERQIRELEEIVEGFDSGQIAPSKRDE